MNLSDDEYRDHVSRLRSAINAAPSSAYSHIAHAGTVGGYSPERHAAHEAILDDAWAELGGDDIPRGRQGLILGGTPGSGKTSVRSTASVPGVGPVQGGFLPIDSDYFKGKLIDAGLAPSLRGFSPMEAAPLMHKESNDIAKKFAQRAYDQGTNLAWDYTLRHSTSGPNRLKEFGRYDYTPHGIYVHATPQDSLARVSSRHRDDLDQYMAGLHRHGGRYVPPEIITDSVHGNRIANRDNYEAIAPRLASSQVFNTSAKQASRRIRAAYEDLPPLPDDFTIPDDLGGENNTSSAEPWTDPTEFINYLTDHHGQAPDAISQGHIQGMSPYELHNWYQDIEKNRGKTPEQLQVEREQSKAKGKEIAESLWGAMFPPEEEEGRKAVQNMDTVNNLMSNGWQPEHIRYDEDDEPYAHYQHPSGWNISDYGGMYKEIGHAATPGESHDVINTSRNIDGQDYREPFGPADAHAHIEEQLHGDPEETGGMFQYLTQEDPRIKKYKPRLAHRTAADDDNERRLSGGGWSTPEYPRWCSCGAGWEDGGWPRQEWSEDHVTSCKKGLHGHRHNPVGEGWISAQSGEPYRPSGLYSKDPATGKYNLVKPFVGSRTAAQRLAMAWYHVSPNDLPVGTHLIPGGGESPHDFSDDDPDWGARSNVWVAPNTDWAGEFVRYHPDDENLEHPINPFIYEVEPHTKPRDTGGGWVTPGATITKVVQRGGATTGPHRTAARLAAEPTGEHLREQRKGDPDWDRFYENAPAWKAPETDFGHFADQDSVDHYRSTHDTTENTRPAVREPYDGEFEGEMPYLADDRSHYLYRDHSLYEQPQWATLKRHEMNPHQSLFASRTAAQRLAMAAPKFPDFGHQLPHVGPMPGIDSDDEHDESWWNNGGCGSMALAFKNTWPDLKIGAEIVDGDTVHHAWVHDGKHAHDAYGTHVNDPTAGGPTHEDGVINMDVDPSDLAYMMDSDWSEDEPWDDSDVRAAGKEIEHHWFGYDFDTGEYHNQHNQKEANLTTAPRLAGLSDQPDDVTDDYSLAEFFQWCAHNHKDADQDSLAQYAAVSGMDNENYLDIYLFLSDDNEGFR